MATDIIIINPIGNQGNVVAQNIPFVVSGTAPGNPVDELLNVNIKDAAGNNVANHIIPYTPVWQTTFVLPSLRDAPGRYVVTANHIPGPQTTASFTLSAGQGVGLGSPQPASGPSGATHGAPGPLMAAGLLPLLLLLAGLYYLRRHRWTGPIIRN